MKIPKLTKEERIEIFESYFKDVERKGLPELIKFLKNSDFFTAPASASFHCNYEGGLFDHSFNVFKWTTILDTIRVKHFEAEENDIESIKICAFFHDLCKINTYQEAEKWTKESGKWVSYKGYRFQDDDVPLGHGEKSLYMIQRFIDLNIEEAAAIRWHMHWSIKSSHSDYPEGMAMRTAMKKFPLVSLIQLADFNSYILEPVVNYKELALEK